ncbi:hypothetical protein EXIGLDRAFT_729250 [Exidia glandulosa HHB12029]|uniref:Uncharacterized protein n=1 Tax=Exidia glandulosa HHB12029 TaxID=1314781 RepID=A0A165ZHN7_EXIGL|nr:hypothetical protein EXIGLDRAFT_729250 [Exidia glandulosa HHB12029]
MPILAVRSPIITSPPVVFACALHMRRVEFFSSHSVLIASSARSLPLSLPNPIPTPLPELPTVALPLTASASHFSHACIFILMMQSRSFEWISIAWREIRPSR